MTLAEHFREFRRRVIVSGASIAVVAIAIGIWFYWPIYWKLTEPWEQYKAANPDTLIVLNFGEATSALSQRISLSIWAGVILSSPIWLYQIWAFIVPGLTKKEKRWSLGFIAAMVPLFLTGVFVAYSVLPTALMVLYGFTPPGASNLQDNAKYFAFVTRLILVFGIGFLLPVFIVALNLVGVLPSRVILGSWRIATLLIMVFAAVATPTGDAYTMLLLGGPLLVLYLIAGVIARFIDRRRERDRPEWATDLADDQASAL
ncbi:MAG: twin-arginine translocase subunit TatC [Actinomycetales bacterium]|nr:twin-arginine translocase subunit TatC [Actinomycetales bacterium]